ncbi:beta-1,6-N-acetylglucosaminyltransferase [Pediococcus pentosaceus]|uniref:beta-1,6-N-acetylglucosaminyltransferase n=1 Tax=Pediococcus pentosaceus TaxID=1255 RepID=UPI000D005787|nr:beta-1,6-N-acetylglucosaminyltransferase [Pediococcus pentosaceus]AVL02768.1 glycosyl transferase [Pediococcus pentosaceus]MBF7134792.1 glycosyl transferase [Pediococcus pentosaceus]QPT36891.1 glycosyl transferase [Pediococcus pentosaceus]
MMQAFLVMTKDINEELLNLIRALDSPKHVIFVHVDKKTGDFDKESVIKNSIYSDIVFVPRIDVTWGGFSLVRAELSLMKVANSYGTFGHFHLLSGEDFPVKSNNQLDTFFEEHPNNNFLEISQRIPNQNKDRFKLRYEQYHLLQDKFIGRKHNVFKYIDFASCYLQRYLGVNRTRHINIQSGANWFSLNQDLLSYIIDNEKWITKHFKNTYCPDESFIQTLIAETSFMKTLYKEGKENLRFVDFYWKAKHNLTPRYLKLDDISLLDDKSYFFARKFNIEVSDVFLKKLKILENYYEK